MSGGLAIQQTTADWASRPSMVASGGGVLVGHKCGSRFHSRRTLGKKDFSWKNGCGPRVLLCVHVYKPIVDLVFTDTLKIFLFSQYFRPR